MPGRILVVVLAVLLCLPAPLLAGPQLLASVHKRRPAQNHHRTVAPARLVRALSAKSAVVMDGDTGEFLFALRPDTPRQPASTIKILTGLLAIKELGPRRKVTASRRAARMPRSKVYLEPGKWYWSGDLIDAVLLASANDAAVALAEAMAGSESRFAARMTETAGRLGAVNTVCRTASGLTARGQHSTARDLAVMFRRAMDNREFARRIGRPRVRAGFGRTLVNHNKALWRIRGAVGGKTGYTRAARQTYVGMFEKNGRSLVVAIMGSETMWDDIARLVRYGFARLRHSPPPERRQPPAEQLAQLRKQIHASAAALQPVRLLTATKKSAPERPL